MEVLAWPLLYDQRVTNEGPGIQSRGYPLDVDGLHYQHDLGGYVDGLRKQFSFKAKSE